MGNDDPLAFYAEPGRHTTLPVEESVPGGIRDIVAECVTAGYASRGWRTGTLAGAASFSVHPADHVVGPAHRACGLMRGE